MALDIFRQDVRIGLRVLRKDKAYFLLAVLVLGLGIGGATTQFTVVNAVALRGLSFPHPEQLVTFGLIDPKATDIGENSAPAGGIQGTNDFGKRNYGGPCPPSGTHRYFFKIYALDTKLDLKPSARRAELDAAMRGHTLAQGELMARYSHK